MQAAWIQLFFFQHWNKTGLSCGYRAPMTIPRPSRQGCQGSCKCVVRRPQPPQGLFRFRRLWLAASAYDVALCCCFRQQRVVSLSINRPTITFATTRSMLIRCSPSKRERSCSVHGDIPQAGVLLSRLTFLHTGRHPLALLHVWNPPPSQTHDSLARAPLGTAGTKMASTLSTCTAGSTWTATRTGSLRRPHTLNGGRTNLVKQPNRRLLGCSATQPKQVCRSGMEPLDPNVRLAKVLGRLTAGPWHTVALHDRP